MVCTFELVDILWHCVLDFLRSVSSPSSFGRTITSQRTQSDLSQKRSRMSGDLWSVLYLIIKQLFDCDCCRYLCANTFHRDMVMLDVWSRNVQRLCLHDIWGRAAYNIFNILSFSFPVDVSSCCMLFRLTTSSTLSPSCNSLSERWTCRCNQRNGTNFGGYHSEVSCLFHLDIERHAYLFMASDTPGGGLDKMQTMGLSRFVS
jgi:hypothetical protein